MFRQTFRQLLSHSRYYHASVLRFAEGSSNSVLQKIQPRSLNKVPVSWFQPRYRSSWKVVSSGIRHVDIPWLLVDRNMFQIATTGWFGNLKSIAGRFKSQALESYCLWHGAHWTNLYGKLWPAERWLLVSGLFRNSRSWMANFAAGIMRPERMLCVATVTSLNTVGNHIPKMTLLLLAQFFTRVGSAEAPSRDSYIPWSRSIPVENKVAVSTWAALFSQIWTEICIWIRLFKLILYFLPLFLLYPLTYVGESSWRLWLSYLRYTLATCGPAFIKWGQWASTRRDLFPPEVSMELKKLQKNAPAHSGTVSKATIERALGLPVEILFEHFDEEPIASGSIGQVHKARLSSMGSIMTGGVPAGVDVAIKVRHPGVDKAFERDMNLMLWIADMIDRVPVLNGFNLHEMICQFSIPMTEQVDFCVEAANLQCFRHNFQKKRDRVTFPEPLFPLVTPDIIVETFHHGVSVDDLIETVKERQPKLAKLGSETFFDMVIRHNLLHADLHPGNILVQFKKPKNFIQSITDLILNLSPYSNKTENISLNAIDTEEAASPSIILLDAGMATQLSDHERHHMLGLFRALGQMDGAKAAEHALQFSGERQTCPDPEAFRRDVTAHFESISQPDWTNSGFDSGADALGHVIDIVRDHQVTLPGQICSCLFSVLILEGWAGKLDPQQSILDQIKDLVHHFDSHDEMKSYERVFTVLKREFSNLTLLK